MCCSHKLQKNTKTTYFGGSKSFKVINDITKKFVTIACYDKQHVCAFCAYLQPFSRYTRQ